MGEELTMSTVTDERPPAPIDTGIDGGDLPRPVRGRALWVIFGSLLLVVGLWWGTYNVVELIAHEERTERFTVPAAQITRLFVDNESGSVTIVGADTDEITVEAEISEGLRRTGFDHQVVESTLELRGSCPVIGSMWCRVTYHVEVPRHLDVDVDVDNDRVNVRQVDGAVVIDTNNGGVDLTEIAGSVVVEGDNGGIVGTGLSSPRADIDTNNGRIELAFTDAPDRVNASGDNGSIEILVPAVAGGYHVTVDTDNGDDDLSGVANNPQSPRTITAETNNGNVRISSP
jgi:hypothetical protein